MFQCVVKRRRESAKSSPTHSSHLKKRIEKVRYFFFAFYFKIFNNPKAKTSIDFQKVLKNIFNFFLYSKADEFHIEPNLFLFSFDISFFFHISHIDYITR